MICPSLIAPSARHCKLRPRGPTAAPRSSSSTPTTTPSSTGAALALLDEWCYFRLVHLLDHVEQFWPLSFLFFSFFILSYFILTHPHQAFPISHFYFRYQELNASVEVFPHPPPPPRLTTISLYVHISFFSSCPFSCRKLRGVCVFVFVCLHHFFNFNSSFSISWQKSGFSPFAEVAKGMEVIDVLYRHTKYPPPPLIASKWKHSKN